MEGSSYQLYSTREIESVLDEAPGAIDGLRDAWSSSNGLRGAWGGKTAGLGSALDQACLVVDRDIHICLGVLLQWRFTELSANADTINWQGCNCVAHRERYNRESASTRSADSSSTGPLGSCSGKCWAG